MKNINILKKIKDLIVFASFALIIFGCETTSLKVEETPNALSDSSADIDLFLNAIQQGISSFHSGEEGSGFDGMSEFGMEPVRMLHGFGPSYRELESPANYNQVWGNAYSFTLADIRSMTPLAEEAGLFTHVAIGQIIESYIMLTLVDFFGDVPYTEAIQGPSGVFNPKLDSGASIYEAAEELLIDAVANLNKDEIALPTTDLYYNGDESKWIKAANTMLLKLYLQTRIANDGGFSASNSKTKINDLISSGNLIFSSADDFQFQWSTNASAPDSRHPFFEKNYGGTGPNSDFYMANYYLNLLANKYSMPDPRIRYYFYRQVSDFSDASTQTQPCSSQPLPAHYNSGDLFCQVPNTNGYNGLWGWDHMNSDGIPPDQQFRTLVGVYPAGGAYDDSSFRNLSGNTAPSEGLQGAGISPFLLSSYTNFMLAESALTLGTTGDAKIYLENGMKESFNKVIAFGASVAQTSTTIPTQADIDAYVVDVMADYDAGNNTQKLKVIVEQYFIALWGNGVEAYNTYRRTGQPSDLQPAVDLADPGTFIRSAWYPSNSADNNSNINQKDDVTQPVFWDTNSAGFVD